MVRAEACGLWSPQDSLRSSCYLQPWELWVGCWLARDTPGAGGHVSPTWFPELELGRCLQLRTFLVTLGFSLGGRGSLLCWNNARSVEIHAGRA